MPGALAIVLAGLALLWWRSNAPPPELGQHFPHDLLNYYYPQSELVAARLAAGELPLWNPHVCSGLPLLATLQAGVFYPATWLYLLVSPADALPWILAGECALGGAFAAAWLRATGAGALAAGVGGLLFVSTCLLGQTFWPPVVATLLWLPWLLLCVEHFAAGGGVRWWIGLSLGTALQLAAGFPQFAVYSFYIVAPYAALRLWQERRRARPARGALALCAAVALGAGLLGAQLLPTLELVGESARVAPVSSAQAHYLAMGRGGSASDFARHALDPSARRLSFDFLDGGGYGGVAAVLLAGVGLATGLRTARVALFAALALAGLVLSQGFHGATGELYRLYASFPPGSLFRTPERLRVLYLFGGLALVAIGLDRLDRGLDRAPDGSRAAGIALLGAGALAAAAVAVFAGAGAGVRAGIALVLLAALAGVRRPRWAHRAAQAGVAVFAIADLVLAAGPYGSLRDFPAAWSRVYHVYGSTVLDATGFAALREEAGLGRLALVGGAGSFALVLPPYGAPPVDGGYRMSCYEPLALRAPTRLTQLLAGGRDAPFGVLGNVDPRSHPTVYDVASVRVALLEERTGNERDLSALVELSGAGRRQTSTPSPDPPLGLVGVRIENDDALPRAYLLEHYRVVPDDDALALVADGGFDFHRGVLLDRDPGPLGPGAAGAPAPAAVRPAEIVSYAPERVEIESDAPVAALLVLTDSHYPGWRATVDGRPAEIFRANGLYRAVRVPEGRHRVVFAYQPDSLRRGAWLSALSAAGLVAIPLLARRRGRRPAAPADGG